MKDFSLLKAKNVTSAFPKISFWKSENVAKQQKIDGEAGLKIQKRSDLNLERLGNFPTSECGYPHSLLACSEKTHFFGKRKKFSLKLFVRGLGGVQLPPS